MGKPMVKLATKRCRLGVRLQKYNTSLFFEADKIEYIFPQKKWTDYSTIEFVCVRAVMRSGENLLPNVFKRSITGRVLISGESALPAPRNGLFGLCGGAINLKFWNLASGMMCAS